MTREMTRRGGKRVRRIDRLRGRWARVRLDFLFWSFLAFWTFPGDAESEPLAIRPQTGYQLRAALDLACSADCAVWAGCRATSAETSDRRGRSYARGGPAARGGKDFLRRRARGRALRKRAA